MPLSVNNTERLEVSGDLTLEHVTRVYEQSRALLPGQVRTVDLGGVSRVDSAGLALLLEWQSEARKRDASLRFEGAPEDLLSLAGLCEATELLGLDARRMEDA